MKNLIRNFRAIHVGIMHAYIQASSYTMVWEENEVTDRWTDVKHS